MLFKKKEWIDYDIAFKRANDKVMIAFIDKTTRESADNYARKTVDMFGMILRRKT